MKKSIQSIIQAAFFVLFFFLLVKGKVQLWIGVLLLGIVSSFLFGRYYCGWLCPINTVMQRVTKVKKKLGIKDRKIPQVLTKPWVRCLALGLFIAVFIFSVVTGSKIPMLPVLFVTGVLLTFLLPEELWHRYLCPYGALLSFPSSRAKKSMQIDTDTCSNCGACRRVCPAEAVENTNSKHRILKADCLVCLECSRHCKKNAISYQ